MEPKHRAIFFDRDGTLIHDANYPRDPEQVLPIPPVIPVLRELQGKGFFLVVISNQSGMGRGIITQKEAEAVHQRFLAVFREQGITFQASYYCPHAPDENCSCRKPSPTMLHEAAKAWGIDLARSFMIGDKESDVLAGKNAGCYGIYYGNPKADISEDVKPDFVSQDWDAIVDFILSREK